MNEEFNLELKTSDELQRELDAAVKAFSPDAAEAWGRLEDIRATQAHEIYMGRDPSPQLDEEALAISEGLSPEAGAQIQAAIMLKAEHLYVSFQETVGEIRLLKQIAEGSGVSDEVKEWVRQEMLKDMKADLKARLREHKEEEK